MDEKFCDYFDRWVKEFKEGNIRDVRNAGNKPGQHRSSQA